MLRKPLIMKLFEGFSIKRWNDQIRPVELVEMDKNGHKMAIAFCLARCEEDAGAEVDWHSLIRGGVFELLRRVVMADIKSPVYRKIRLDHPEVFEKISDWVFKQLRPVLPSDTLREEVREYLSGDGFIDKKAQEILSAAHVYASYWEFGLLRNANPNGHQVQEIDRMMLSDIEKHLDLVGMRSLLCKAPIAQFIDLFGQLRFQVRWSQTPRVPPTSVLGHAMFVAVLSYLMSREVAACSVRIRNNFFGGLFHDLPETLTRDIISPIKRAEPSFPAVIGKIERELVRAELYPLLPDSWHTSIEYLIEEEFSTKITRGGETVRCSSDEVNAAYNSDVHNPYDGEIVKVCDDLSAFVEAHVSCETGISTPHLERGKSNLKDTYLGTHIAGIDIGSIFADF